MDFMTDLFLDIDAGRENHLRATERPAWQRRPYARASLAYKMGQ
jgi:hypothetical protein